MPDLRSHKMYINPITGNYNLLQQELIKSLERIWNNQEFLTEEDLKILDFLGKRGVYDKQITI